MFKSLFAKIFKSIGAMSVSGTSNACLMVILDEPEMPKSLIER